MSRFLYIVARELDMSPIAKSICWAAAMLGVAILSAFGMIERTAATTMFIVLPVLAATSLTSARRSSASCGTCK